MARNYTGFDEIAGGKRAGFEMLMDLLEAHFGLWNNGTFAVRNKRGKSSYSVHATGRAGDLSWRGGSYRGTGNYADAEKLMDFCAEHADALDIEAIFDYYPQPYGRGWKCDRAAWQVYSKRAFSGAPGGDWVHIEIGNKYADDPDYYVEFFKKTLGEAKNPPKKTTTVKAPSGKKPWVQLGSKGADVKKVQEIVGASPVDGDFGPKTQAAVKKWQADHDQYVDGIWGPGSQKHSENCDCKDAAPAPAPAPAEAPKATAKPAATSAKRPYPGTPLRKGSTGKDVKAVQEVVGTRIIDGQFGSKTQAAVKTWQRANPSCGPADGIVGPKTWAVMF